MLIVTEMQIVHAASVWQRKPYCYCLFAYCELKLVTFVNAAIALVIFTIFVHTMGVTVSEVFKNDFLKSSFRSSAQQSTRFIVWTLPTIVLHKIKEHLDIYQLLTFSKVTFVCMFMNLISMF